MKINIITRHAISNYGSLLQSYATQKILKQNNCDSEIIDYIREDEKTENLVNTFVVNSHFFNRNRFTRFLYKKLQYSNFKKMDTKFLEMRKQYLNLTKQTFSNSEDLKKYNFDSNIFCTGSDQVWGKIGTSEFDENYFLNFVNSDAKCFSYAASFGKVNLSNEIKDKIPELLKKYSSILVRENSALEILDGYGIKEAKQVLDPTLMLDKDEWEKLITKKDDEYNSNRKYILVYQLHHSKLFDSYLKKLAKKTKLPVIRISPSKYFALKPGKLKYLPNLSEFLSLFKNAEMVLTDSFHGTVFSIIFNINFIDILPNLTGTRIESLLKLFNLENRIILGNEFNFELIDKKINYNSVNKILNNEKNNSNMILKDVLNNLR